MKIRPIIEIADKGIRTQREGEAITANANPTTRNNQQLLRKSYGWTPNLVSNSLLQMGVGKSNLESYPSI